MQSKVYGVVGCGWLGMPMAEKWIQEQKTVHGTTTSKDKIKNIETAGIIPHVLDNEKSEQDTKWLFELDFLLLNIPPSNLKEEYGNYMLKIVKQLNPTAKIIFISSTSVYANNNKEVTEEDELEGTRKNSACIINAENMLKEFAKDRLTIIRMSGLVGKDRNPAIYMQGRKINGGKDPVNLIHLEDCMGTIDFMINGSIWGEIFNASAPTHPAKEDYYVHAAKQLNVEPPTFKDESQSYKIIDSTKLIKEYGYSFKYLDPYIFPEINLGEL